MTARTGTLTTLGGLALGAGLMYVLDPDRGESRRQKLRRQLVRAGRRATAVALEARRIAQHPARLFT